jgi:hypothetical protein
MIILTSGYFKFRRQLIIAAIAQLFLLILLGTFCFAQNNIDIKPKAVLIIAVKMESNRASEQYFDNLEQNFLNKFKNSGFNTEVIRNATVEQIHNELMNPDNTAIYLVAHSATNYISSGLSSAAVIDSNNNKLNETLKSTSNRLKFFALIGCESKLLLETYRKKYYNSTLQVFGFTTVVEARDSVFFSESCKWT